MTRSVGKGTLIHCWDQFLQIVDDSKRIGVKDLKNCIYSWIQNFTLFCPNKRTHWEGQSETLNCMAYGLFGGPKQPFSREGDNHFISMMEVRFLSSDSTTFVFWCHALKPITLRWSPSAFQHLPNPCFSSAHFWIAQSRSREWQMRPTTKPTIQKRSQKPVTKPRSCMLINLTT